MTTASCANPAIEDPAMTDHRRRRLLIDRRFQFALIGKLLALQLLLLGATLAALWIFADSELGATLQRAQSTVSSVRALLKPVLVTMGLLNALLATAATFGVVLVASHRIAGPLYRIQTALKEVADGNLRPLTRIRVHDQTEALADQLHLTLVRLTEDIETAQERLAAAVLALESAGAPVPPDIAAAREALARYH
jgi:HAMP domain-containing protein